MAPENRAEWQNFVDSADIQPLGSAYGYQLEIPFENRERIDRFFEDPRNLRGLIGEISHDPSRNPRAAAVRTKRMLQQNPQFLRDVDLLLSRSPRAAMAAIEDAYAMRQLFGEVPGQYGAEQNDASTERRGITQLGTNQRVRVSETGGFDRQNIPTSELSPSERTRATSRSLDPAALAVDLEFLGDTGVLAQAGVSPDSPVERARQLLFETLAREVPHSNYPISLDASSNVDDEALRRLVNRNDLGQLEISGHFPGEFVTDLNLLLRERNADPDYILNYLQESGELPSQASEPQPEWSDFDDEEPRQLVGQYGPAVDRLIREFPETESIKAGPSAVGSRLDKNQLFEKYGSLIPYDYKRLPSEEVQSVVRALEANDNPDVKDYVYKTLTSSFVDKSKPVENLNKLLEFSKNIKNQSERDRVTNYLKDYLKNIDTKLLTVSPRAAGVGGGDYLDESDIRSLYPRAYKKLQTLGDIPYVPEDFEPTIRSTFYSNEYPNKSYTVEIEREAGQLSAYRGLSENFVRLIDEKPFAGVYSIGFKVNGDYSADPNVPDDVKANIQNFIRGNALKDIPAGSLVVNSPLGNELFRKGSNPVNKRALTYQQAGFGGQSIEGQFAYIDPETGRSVPVQPTRSKSNLSKIEEGRSYYSLDPSIAAVRGLPELGRAIRKVPSALLPGAADLIPSPEAIRTGYAQGPVAMGKQMAQEFVQGLPAAAGLAGALSTPLAAPLAPGIGAGFVGTAGARALNEIVRQETGEGVVPKLRQFLGTVPRTGVSAKPSEGNKPLTATLQALTPAQKVETQRQSNRNELQRRVDLVKERFNPRRGEFGLSELLLGR